MLTEKIIALAQKLFKGTASEAEKQELHQWYDQWQDDEETINTFPNEDSEESIRMRMLTQIKTGMKQRQPAKVIPVQKKWYRFAAAASIVSVLSVAGFLFMDKNNNQDEMAANAGKQENVAAPVANKAMITLADGRRVSIDSIQSGSLARQHDVNVVKTADGRIEYSVLQGEGDDQLAYNTLDNPRGSRVQPITLGDGTKVWLNSESSLHYPVQFTGKERHVEVTGEAYFEVAKNAAKPFKVAIAGKAEVEVLGTHFNINSYSDEANINTTLLEGKIKLTQFSNQQSVTLAPGQQGIFNTNGPININSDVDVDEVMAWKNDLFNFNSLDAESIMRQVGRWYDLEVSFEGQISRETYSGIVSRNSDLVQVLKVLEEGGLKYKIAGKKIVLQKMK